MAISAEADTFKYTGTGVGLARGLVCLGSWYENLVPLAIAQRLQSVEITNVAYWQSRVAAEVSKIAELC